MINFSIKLISIMLILILSFHIFSSLIPFTYINDNVKAAASLENDDVLRGLGITVLLYILSRIGQELITPENPTIDDLEDFEELEDLDEDSDEDIELLARVIHAEARGEPVEGQIAVGAVVLNRLESSKFPDNIYEIIFEKKQFSSVTDGQINLSPNKSSFDAAEQALSGKDPTDGALYFYNPETSDPDNLRWLEDNTSSSKVIGDHVFAE